MEKTDLRRLSLSSSTSTLINFKLKKHYKQENKKWEWLDLSDSTVRLNANTDIYRDRDRGDYRKRDDEEEDDGDESLLKNWATTLDPLNNDPDDVENGEERGELHSTNPSSSASHLMAHDSSSVSRDDLFYQAFDDHRVAGEKLVNFYQTKKVDQPGIFESQNPYSFSPSSGSSSNRFVRSPAEPKQIKNNKANMKMGFHHRTSNTAFTSSNIYLRPLPANFTPLDLHELCMSMVRSSSPEKCKKFHILSVKVMIEEEDETSLGSCKGFGFCLWNSVQASTACIEGLRAHGYQASFARESSRGMLSSLADPTSANIYLSNLPHHWGEDKLKALFGDTPIASARLLRDRDDEAVGSGASRGVGFVRLACRSDALHFVELLHGMPIPGTNCHLQCRMADSQAQKEWKRNVRSSFKQPSAVEIPAQKNQPRGSIPGLSLKKWSGKKPTQNVPSIVPPGRRGSTTKPQDQSMLPNYNDPGLDGMSGGGFHVVGLGSPAAPVLMPPFHAASPLPNHGPIITTANSRLSPAMAPVGNEIQRIFPIGPAFFPVYPPAWYPQQACPGLNFSPGSNYSTANSSPYGQNWPSDPHHHPNSPPPPPPSLPQNLKSFGYYHPDSSYPNLFPQLDQVNDPYDSARSLSLNIIDQNSSDDVHSSFNQPVTSESMQEFYASDPNVKDSEQAVPRTHHDNTQEGSVEDFN